MENTESFGEILGEFLDKAILALDDLSFATEQFIDKSVEGKFVKPHPADTERLRKVGLSETDLIGKTEKPSKAPQSPKKVKKSEEEQTKPAKNTEKKENSAETTEKAVKTEIITNENLEDSQENSQRRRKHKHRHHSRPQEE